MSRTLYFTQITDDRFDTDIKNLLEKRTDRLKKLLNLEGVEVTVSPIEEIRFDGNNQCRCRFEIKKTTNKVTWNDIYKIVNSVKPVPYNFR